MTKEKAKGTKTEPAVKKTKKRAEYGVTPKEFIEIWETSHTAQEAADRLKMPKPIVLARVSSYRKAGLPLKNMPRDMAGRQLPIDDLRKELDAIRKKHGIVPSNKTADGIAAVPDDVREAIVNEYLKAHK